MAAANGFAPLISSPNSKSNTHCNRSVSCHVSCRSPMQIVHKSSKIRGILLNPRCEVVPEKRIEDNKIDSRRLSVSALELLKSSSADRYTKERSSIVVIGLNVNTAPVDVREKLSIPESLWPQAINELCALNHIEEAGVLCTCNRMEIYVVALSQHRGVKEVTEWMSKRSGVSVSELSQHQFLLYNKDATQHLFEVASGLNSLVLGEGQILAQVRQVVKVGQGVAGFCGKISGLFKHAITVGNRVRTETNISLGSVSVSSAAVELALMKLPQPSFAAVRVLIIGAGKMGKPVIQHLVAKGCTKVVVINRTEEGVSAFTDELQGAEIIYKPLTEMLACTAEADVIFTSATSETPLFLKQDIQMLPPMSPHLKSRIFIDISVPGNIGSCVSELENACVYKVDDLKQVIAANNEETAQNAMEAQAIIFDELQKFKAWKDSLDTVPTIKKFQAYVERIRASEVEKCSSKLGDDISTKHKTSIHDLSMGIVTKLLHGPMQHLKHEGSDICPMNDVLENMRAINRMYELENDTSLLEQKIRAKMERAQK